MTGLVLRPGIAEQGEHVGDMVAVLRAQKGRLGVGTQIIVAVGQAEPALAGVGDVGCRILEVLLRLQLEQDVETANMPVAHERRDFVRRVQRGNGCQIVAQRRQASALDRCLVHRSGVKIADLPDRGGHVAGVRRRVFQNVT
jgi:hypothetical protein